MDTAPSLSVVLPVYNEEKSLETTVRRLWAVQASHPFELIVVNDGSTDGTHKQLEALADARMTVLHHERNAGYGASIKTAVQAAAGDCILITDADGTYPLERIPEFHALLKDNGVHMVVGARCGPEVNIPWVRKPAKWVLNMLANVLTERKIPDLNSGFRIMDKATMLRFLDLLPDGFSLTTTITLAMLCNRCRVLFVPINYGKREGKSKIGPIRDTLRFLQLIVRTVMYFNPLKIFLPFSLFFILLSAGLSIYRAIYHRFFGVTSVMLFVLGIQLLATGMLADLINKRLGSRK